VQAVVPDGRRRRGRRRQLDAEADGAGEGGGVGDAGEERVGPLVDGGEPGERRRAQLAAEAVVGFAQLDRCDRQQSGQLVGDGEPGDPTADDEDPGHWCTVVSYDAPDEAAFTKAPVTQRPS
jgi:hypothetical protein